MIGNYPDGAESDPRAPYNQPDAKPVICDQCGHKSDAAEAGDECDECVGTYLESDS